MENKGISGAVERINEVKCSPCTSGRLASLMWSPELSANIDPQLVRKGPLCHHFVSFLAFRAVFIPAQIINFAIVPHHLRFGFVSVVSLFWSRWPRSSGTTFSLRPHRYLSQRCECTNTPRRQEQAHRLIPSIVGYKPRNIVYLLEFEDTRVLCNYILYHTLQPLLQNHAGHDFV